MRAHFPGAKTAERISREESILRLKAREALKAPQVVTHRDYSAYRSARRALFPFDTFTAALAQALQTGGRSSFSVPLPTNTGEAPHPFQLLVSAGHASMWTGDVGIDHVWEQCIGEAVQMLYPFLVGVRSEPLTEEICWRWNTAPPDTPTPEREVFFTRNGVPIG